MDDERGPIRSVERTLDIIEFIRDEGRTSLSTIASDLGYTKSTTHRHIKTLAKRGYVVNEGGEYRLGLRFLELGKLAQELRPEHRLALSKVNELAVDTKERVQFMVEENGWAVYVYQQLGEHAVETDTYPGKRVPMHASAAGLAILSEFQRDDVDAILDRRGLEACTPETITDRGELHDELRRSQERGYSINDQGIIEGLRAIGAPILDPDGEVIGALSISGPINRMRGERFDEELPALLLGATNELELRIAYQ